MLPEPQVTVATMGNDKTRIALDLTEEWDKISDYNLVQGCIIVNKEFAEKYPDALNHSNFPSIVLKQGQEYTHTCIYKFILS